MGTTALRGAAALVTALALACAPAAAQSPFSPPTDLSDPQLNSFDQDVAIAPSGEAVAVWHRRIDDYNSVSEAVTRSAGGGFGPPTEISSEKWHSLDHHVAMDPNGNAVIVYRKSNDYSTYNLFAVTRPAGGDFSDPVEVSDGEERNGTFVINPDVGVDAAGNAIAIWVQNDDWKVHYAIRPPGGRFGAPQAIPNPADYVFEPDYAVAANGDATAVWASEGGQVHASVRRSGQPFGTPQVLSQRTDSGPQPSVAMDPKGNAIVTWMECASSDCGDAYEVYSYRPAGGTFGPPARIAKVFWAAYEPEVAFAPNGEAAIAWAGDSLEPRLYTGITAVVRPPGGTFGPPEPVTHPDNSPGDVQPRLAYDDAGNLYVGWRHILVNDGSSGRLEGHALAAVRNPGHRFDETTYELSRSDRNVWPPAIAAAGDGRALFTWALGVFGSQFWVQAADYLGSGGLTGYVPGDSSTGEGDRGGGERGGYTEGTTSGSAPEGRLRVTMFVPRHTSRRKLFRSGVVVRVRASRPCRARIALALGAKKLAVARRSLRRRVLRVRLRPTTTGRRAVLARGGTGLRAVMVATGGRERVRVVHSIRVR